MLPDPDYCPSSALEQAIGFLITRSVLRDLGGPEFGIRPGDCVMHWAPVPEAAVYEDGDVATGKDKVGSPVKRREWARVDPIAQSEGMDRAPNCQLRPCVTTTVRLHPASDAR